jgi:hypothetical protein
MLELSDPGELDGLIGRQPQFRESNRARKKGARDSCYPLSIRVSKSRMRH